MTMENTTAFDNFMNQPKRSQFLTVLCVLSFIMCGVSLITGLLNIYQSQPDVMQKRIEQVRTVDASLASQMEDQFIASQSNEFMKVYPYLNLIFLLLSFVGVMMMWNLKKKGFYIYSIAEILPYSSMFFLDKNAMTIPGLPASAFASIMGTMVIVDVLFVFLYFRNTADME